jgi:hypothetical protein
MSSSQMEWLRDYLVQYGFNVPEVVDLQTKISGMSADEIITAMEQAKLICDRLKDSSLGKELG